jgi:hypothetical protein
MHDTGFQWSVHQGKYKLLVTANEDFAAKLEKQYHLTLAHGVNLFDLEADPAEKTNIAQEHPEVVKELTALHDAWRKECRPPATGNASSEH